MIGVALVLFTVLTEPRTALRPRTIAVVVLMVALGLAQYGFIILRTLQHAPYLEARAANLQELWAVMTAGSLTRSACTPSPP